jgi:hypothetical protein
MEGMEKKWIPNQQSDQQDTQGENRKSMPIHETAQEAHAL